MVSWTEGDYDAVLLHDGGLLRTHGSKMCEGRRCPIHNPSKHHMIEWPHVWRADQGILERRCLCGVNHPDPDDYKVRMMGGTWLHACCPISCCWPPGVTANLA